MISHLCAGRIFLVATFIISQAWSLNIPTRVAQEALGDHQLTKRKTNNSGFHFQEYDQFQISDGIAGNSRDKAVMVFLKPFGLDLDANFEIGPEDRLKAVSKKDLEDLKKMAKAASDNEIPGFVATIKKTQDKKVKARLQVGMIANKVLKLVGQQAYLAIELAHGKTERRQKLDEEKKKLKKNIDLDVKNKGKQMVSYLHPK
ncbi:secreted protein [Melampsora americana]|nr:secreted protein [Melampsora americana]